MEEGVSAVGEAERNAEGLIVGVLEVGRPVGELGVGRAVVGCLEGWRVTPRAVGLSVGMMVVGALVVGKGVGKEVEVVGWLVVG
jgi:hypothetical protein